MPVKQEKAPALDVKIPNPSLSYESLGMTSTSRGSQLLAGVKLPAGPKDPWPGPTRLTVDQASGNHRRETLHPVFSLVDDPYVDQGDRHQHGVSFTTLASDFALASSSPETNKRHLGEDKGYFSEVESNADVSEPDGLASVCPNVAPGSLEAGTNSPCCRKDPAASYVNYASSVSPYQGKILPRMSSSVPSESNSTQPENIEGTAGQRASLHSSSRMSSHHSAGPEEGLDTLHPSHKDAMRSKPRVLYKRLPSDVYDADAESVDSSMASRAAWERHRADRERRYMEIIDMAPKTESDEEVGPELELKRSPSRKPVHYAQELILGTVNIKRSDSSPGYPTGALRYAVEAIERPAFPVGDFAYAVEAIERPSVTTFDPLETVFQQRPMLRISDTMDEIETLRASDPPELSLSRMEAPSSPPTSLSPSRVELPSSPESSPADIPASPKYQMMTMTFIDEELMTLRAGSLDVQRIRRSSPECTEVFANSSSEQSFRTAREDAYEASLKAVDLLVPTYLSQLSGTMQVGEDAYEAGLKAAGILMPIDPSITLKARPAMKDLYEEDLQATFLSTPIFKKTCDGAYREQMEAGSILPMKRPRNATPFEHSRTQSAFSDYTDDGCAVMTHSPSCNAPPPFPTLHVQSEPARRITGAVDALATRGDEEILITRPANAGTDPSLPSPFDSPGDQSDEARLKHFSPKALESPNNYAQVKRLEPYDIQSPSPDSTSSAQSPQIQPPSNGGASQERSGVTQLPSSVSSSLICSRKARRQRKKSSSNTGTVPFAELTMNPKNTILEPEFGSPKRELNKNSALGKPPTSLGERIKIAGGSVQKSSPNRHLSRKDRRSIDQASLEDFTEVVGDSARWLDSSPKSMSGKKIPRNKGHTAAALAATSNSLRTKMTRTRAKASCDELRESAGSPTKDSKSRVEPEFSIKHFDSTSDRPPLYPNRRSGSTSYAGYELDNLLREDPLVTFCHKMSEETSQHSDKKAISIGCSDETIGKNSESPKDVTRALGQQKNKKPPTEAEKKFAVQRELERKSERAPSRLVGKLKGGVLGDDHIREEESPHRDGRPPWRP